MILNSPIAHVLQRLNAYWICLCSPKNANRYAMLAAFGVSMLIATLAYVHLEAYLNREVIGVKPLAPTAATVALRTDAVDVAALKALATESACLGEGIFTSDPQCRPTHVEPVDPQPGPQTEPCAELIFLIKACIVLGLGIQIFLAIYVVALPQNKLLDRHVFHLSDFALTTPPILGILINLLSFALLLRNGTENISSLFAANFYTATVTTFIGGLFYIFNLALKIIIQSNNLELQ